MFYMFSSVDSLGIFIALYNENRVLVYFTNFVMYTSRFLLYWYICDVQKNSILEGKLCIEHVIF